MRVYVPAVLSDLSVPLPPVRSGVLCVPETGMSGEDVEVLEDDAITEAALSSLDLARETEGAGTARVVLAVDTPTSTTLTPGDQIEPHIFEAAAFEYTWSDVAAILVDRPVGVLPGLVRPLRAPRRPGPAQGLTPTRAR